MASPQKRAGRVWRACQECHRALGQSTGGVGEGTNGGVSKIIRSMPRILFAVVRAKNGYTKY